MKHVNVNMKINKNSHKRMKKKKKNTQPVNTLRKLNEEYVPRVEMIEYKPNTYSYWCTRQSE